MLGSQISTHLTGRAHAGLNAVDVSNYEKLKEIKHHQYHITKRVISPDFIWSRRGLMIQTGNL